jgi:TIR domain-containing protein/F5/8 type C domain-containing protein
VEKQSPLTEPQSGKAPGFAAFISHAKGDQKRAREIAASLEKRGLKCWIAPRDVRPGQSYGDEIIRGIEKSRCFILILSKASNESPFVAREVERAVSKRKPIFPIRIEDVEPSSALELFISSTQWIDAFSGSDSQVDNLANLLAADDGAEAVQAVSTPVPVTSKRPGGWVRPAALAIAVLLGGLAGAFLWDSYRKPPESVPPQASAPSTAISGAPQVAPAAALKPSAEPKPGQAPQPALATPQAAPPPTPEAAAPEEPRPHAANEDCSRSGDTTLCASSVLTPAQGNTYGPRNLADGDDKTAWVEGSGGQGAGEFVVFEFDQARTVRGLTIRNGYDKSPDIFAKNSRVKDIELRFSSGDTIETTLKDQSGPQHLALNQPITAKWVEIVIRSVYPGTKYSDTAINEIDVDAN